MQDQILVGHIQRRVRNDHEARRPSQKAANRKYGVRHFAARRDDQIIDAAHSFARVAYDWTANHPCYAVSDGQRPEIDNNRRDRLRSALRERLARQFGGDQDAAGDRQNRAHGKPFDRRIEAIVVAGLSVASQRRKILMCAVSDPTTYGERLITYRDAPLPA